MASQTSHGAFGATHAPRDLTRVVVLDHRPRGAADGIEDAVARCSAKCVRVSAASMVPRAAGDCEIGLVAFAGRPLPDSPVLGDIRRLKERGYTVLCCADGAREWPPGVQCRLLLAGATEVLDSGAAGFAGELCGRLGDLVKAASERERETADLRRRMLGLGVVGCSPRITEVFRWIVSASAVSDLPVLLTGETGTGKELAAHAIHQLDPRRCHRPFVAVNCGAISAGLAESELFGHRRGAFTGAERDRLGLIRVARGGVLFLDEIGDLEWNVQTKLLRVLQERRVLAVGDDHEVPVDVRVIAATNRDLEEMVSRHAFRADLFHRLNVLSIRLPALRERPEDVEPLVTHFLALCAAESGHDHLSASREFVDALRHLELPGNVRQLENVVRRAVVTSKRGGCLRLSDLPSELWLELSRADDPPASDETTTDGASPSSSTAHAQDRASPLDPVAVLDAAAWKLEGALDLCERKLVAAALGASRGNRSRAARLLGISPRCIFNKMRKYRLTA